MGIVRFLLSEPWGKNIEKVKQFILYKITFFVCILCNVNTVKYRKLNCENTERNSVREMPVVSNSFTT